MRFIVFVSLLVAALGCGSRGSRTRSTTPVATTTAPRDLDIDNPDRKTVFPTTPPDDNTTTNRPVDPDHPNPPPPRPPPPTVPDPIPLPGAPPNPTPTPNPPPTPLPP